jgi:hypothetical protein
VKVSVRAYFDLVRLPNLFTAAADILGGHLYAHGSICDYGVLLRLSIGSMCLYAGGVALNDVCDAETDARERPNRPIPRGDLSRTRAGLICAILLVAGVALTASTSANAAAISPGLVVCIVLYNGVLKSTFAAPALMGICRALNLALGLSADITHDDAIWGPVLLMWLYVTSLTFFARKESGGGSTARLKMGTLGLFVSTLGLLALRADGAPPINAWSITVVLVAIHLLATGLGAVRQPEPKNIQTAVKRFVLFIIVFDTLIAASAIGVVPALFVALLLIPAAVAGKLFRVT